MEQNIATANTTYIPEASVRTVETGSVIEAIGGVGAIVLTVLGLIGVLPEVFLSIAIMIVGVAMILAGSSVAAQFDRLTGEVESRTERREVLGGVGVEAVAGLGGTVLGLLALLQVDPVNLLTVAAIVLGGGMLLASGATARLETLLERLPVGESGHRGMMLSGGGEVLVGLGAVALGILALAGLSPIILTMIAVLGLGVSMLLTGSSMATRIFGLFG